MALACNGFSFALFLAPQIYMSNQPKIAEKNKKIKPKNRTEQSRQA